jgi:hypothetical protein
LVFLALVLWFATAAGAGMLTVFTTDTANIAKNAFDVGETILLKVTGDSQGAQSGLCVLNIHPRLQAASRHVYRP